MDLCNFNDNYQKIRNERKYIGNKKYKEMILSLFDGVTDKIIDIPNDEIYYLLPNRILCHCPECGKIIYPRFSDCYVNIGKTKCRKCALNDHNKTRTKTCDECSNNISECEFFNFQKENKYSNSIFCYTVLNKQSDKLGWDKIWKNNPTLLLEHACNQALKNTKDGNSISGGIGKHFWDIFKNNDTNDPEYEKAMRFCTKALDNIHSNKKYIKDECGNITHIIDIKFGCTTKISLNNYIENIKKLPINFVPNGFKIIPTGRSQDSENRNQILDNYLVKNNITYFVYIKYDELGYPLVVGRSASKLVNFSGWDVTFDKNPNGGSARQYLINNGLDWNKTQISIFPCENKNEALNIEFQIQYNFNLFSS